MGTLQADLLALADDVENEVDGAVFSQDIAERLRALVKAHPEREKTGLEIQLEQMARHPAHPEGAGPLPTNMEPQAPTMLVCMCGVVTGGFREDNPLCPLHHPSLSAAPVDPTAQELANMTERTLHGPIPGLDAPAAPAPDALREKVAKELYYMDTGNVGAPWETENKYQVDEWLRKAGRILALASPSWISVKDRLLAWHQLSKAEQKEWNDGVTNDGRTIYQAYEHAYRLITGHEMPLPEPPAGTGEKVGGE